MELAPSAARTSERGVGIAEGIACHGLPGYDDPGRALEPRRSRDACLACDAEGRGARAERGAWTQRALPALVLPRAHRHAWPATAIRCRGAAHAARPLSREYRLPRLRGLALERWCLAERCGRRGGTAERRERVQPDPQRRQRTLFRGELGEH